MREMLKDNTIRFPVLELGSNNMSILAKKVRPSLKRKPQSDHTRSEEDMGEEEEEEEEEEEDEEEEDEEEESVSETDSEMESAPVSRFLTTPLCIAFSRFSHSALPNVRRSCNSSSS
jgi:hypothetical protein